MFICAFNTAVEGTERLGALSKNIRASLLEVIYDKMLSSCDLLQITERQTALMFCQHIQPQVCLTRFVVRSVAGKTVAR